MMEWKRVVPLGVLLLAGSLEARAGELEAARSEIRDGGGSSSSRSSDDDDDDSSGSSLFALAYALEDASETQTSFRSYPYQDGARGYRFETDPDDPDPPGRRVAGRLWAEGAWLSRGLWRSGAGLRIDGQLFGFDGDLSYYLEPAARDALYLGTANLDVIPLHARRALWRFGGGISTMIDGRVPGQDTREYALGWNITSSLDLFPASPLVLSARIDAGRLHGAVMGRIRGTIGVALGRVHLYGGYAHTQVGTVGLGGPTLGLGLWL